MSTWKNLADVMKILLTYYDSELLKLVLKYITKYKI